MLRFVIISCILCCISAQSPIGVYRELVLLQHSPLASFYWQQNILQDEFSVNRDFLRHAKKQQIEINDRRWVVNGLWALDTRSQYLTHCKTLTGDSPSYNHNNMDPEFVERLTNEWPNLGKNETHIDLWTAEYECYGSCISIHTSYFFDSALKLSEKYNVGALLEKKGIVPGATYELSKITNAIKNTWRALVYLRCVPSQDPDRQYLLEVQLCFTPALKMINCLRRVQRPDVLECDTKKSTYYLGLLGDDL